MRRVTERAHDGDELDDLCAVERACIADEMASFIRHDLRNKLGAIRNAAFYLRKRMEPIEAYATDPRAAHMFALIEQTLKQADDLVAPRAVLEDFFERRAGTADVSTAVTRATASLRMSDRVDVEVEPARVSGDEDIVVVALRCLLCNASEAGARTIRVRGRSGDPRAYALSVEDDGPGVEPTELEALRCPFVTTKPGHVGIGLALADRLARRLGGQLLIERIAHDSGLRATLSLTLL